jgi:hypothetical protein
MQKNWQNFKNSILRNKYIKKLIRTITFFFSFKVHENSLYYIFYTNKKWTSLYGIQIYNFKYLVKARGTRLDMSSHGDICARRPVAVGTRRVQITAGRNRIYCRQLI